MSMLRNIISGERWRMLAMQLRARAFTLTLTLLSGIVKPAHPVSRKEAAKCREQYTSGTAASVKDPTSHA